MANYISKHTGKQIDAAVDSFLAGGGTGSVEVDTTLTQAGKAADAKATGKRITKLSEEIDQLKSGESVDVSETGTVVSIEADAGENIRVEANTTGAVTLVHQGKNFLPSINSESGTRNGLTYALLDDGSIQLAGTLTATVFLDIATATTPFFLPAGTYKASLKGSEGQNIKLVLHNVDTGNTIVGVGYDFTEIAFTLSEGANVQAYVQIAKDNAVDTVVYPQVELGNAVSAYEKCARVERSVTLPTTLSAVSGTNIIYTTSGDVITTSTTKVVAESIDDKIAKAMKFDPVPFGLPILNLIGDTAGMSKDDAVTLDYTYGERNGTCTVKWQGSSSLTYPKKNYTIKFDTAFEAKEGWGEQKKYCMKANFVDFSHSRNVCGAKLWGQIVAKRTPDNAMLAACPNYGAVDGFHIVITINNEYVGVYCFNIPKDGWMLNMGNGEKEAILCADLNSDANLFKAEAVVGGDKTDFELEYVSDENNTAWVQTSLNNLIRACINSDGTDLDTTIADMLDWDSAIDYFIFSALIDNRDGISKNYLLHTYDGVKWVFDAYDMDSIFGLQWDGKAFLPATGGYTFAYVKTKHRVAELILTYKKDALKARYKALRANVLSEDNIALTFRNFAGNISRTLLDEDNRKWPAIPNTNCNNVQQAIDWYRLRVQKIDAEIEAM